jgi:hypothetical protein
VFGRRSQPAQAEEPVDEPEGPGKGRPTPKRRDAEAARRQRVAAPKDRKEAARLARQRQREARLKTRQALSTGDERNLPLRDRGPVRRYARDFVDSRRSLGEYFMIIALGVLVMTFIPSVTIRAIGTYVWLLLIVLIITDGWILNLRLKRKLREKFPNESLQGVTMYAVMRSMQLRKLRLPKPRVKPGDQI